MTKYSQLLQDYHYVVLTIEWSDWVIVMKIEICGSTGHPAHLDIPPIFPLVKNPDKTGEHWEDITSQPEHIDEIEYMGQDYKFLQT